jgi:hypothetical protein
LFLFPSTITWDSVVKLEMEIYFMDYDALESELRNDPLQLGYEPFVTSGADQDLARILNQDPSTFSTPKTWTSINPLIPMSSVLIWAASGPLDSLHNGTTSSNSSVRSACLAAIQLLSLPSITTFDPTAASTSALLSGFVEATVLTQTQVDELNSLTIVPATRGEVLFGNGVVVSHNDVATALRGN